MVPQINYVLNEKGTPVFVQMTVKEWEKFLHEYERFKAIATFKARLETAFQEIRQIQRGEKQGTTLTDFLNEL